MLSCYYHYCHYHHFYGRRVFLFSFEVRKKKSKKESESKKKRRQRRNSPGAAILSPARPRTVSSWSRRFASSPRGRRADFLFSWERYERKKREKGRRVSATKRNRKKGTRESQPLLPFLPDSKTLSPCPSRSPCRRGQSPGSPAGASSSKIVFVQFCFGVEREREKQVEELEFFPFCQTSAPPFSSFFSFSLAIAHVHKVAHDHFEFLLDDI